MILVGMLECVLYCCFYLQKKKAISRRKDINDDLATYCYNMKVGVLTKKIFLADDFVYV